MPWARGYAVCVLCAPRTVIPVFPPGWSAESQTHSLPEGGPPAKAVCGLCPGSYPGGGGGADELMWKLGAAWFLSRSWTRPQTPCSFECWETVGALVLRIHMQMLKPRRATGAGVCRILVPCPGVEPAPPPLEAQSLNLWTTRGVPRQAFWWQRRVRILSSWMDSCGPRDLRGRCRLGTPACLSGHRRNGEKASRNRLCRV